MAIDPYGYVLGLSCTDGWLQIRKHSDGVLRYRFRLVCKSEIFMKRAFDAWKSLLPKARFAYHPETRRNIRLPNGGITSFSGFRLLVISRLFVERLLADKLLINNREYESFSEETLRAIVIATVDSDGHVRPTGEIEIGQKHPDWIVGLLERLKIPYRLRRSGHIPRVELKATVGRTIDTFKQPKRP